MTSTSNYIITIIMVFSMLLAGCTGEEINEPEDIVGCMDNQAINYDSEATVEISNSCEYADSDNDGILDINEILGCMDSAATNFDSLATDDDGACLIPWESEYGVNWVQQFPGGGCECADGAEWFFWSRDADPSKVLLYFEGGGACFEDQGCKFQGGTFKTSISSDGPAVGSVFNSDLGGISNFRNPANPFADWSVVYVPYCTGDIHLGNAVTEYAYAEVNHSGHKNSQAAYNFLTSHYTDASKIFVTGSSAGSFPAPFYGILASNSYPDAEITVFNDGSGGVYTNGTYDVVSNWNLNETMGDFLDEYRDFNFFDSADMVIQAWNHDNSIRFGRYDNTEDDTMKYFNALLGNDIRITYSSQVFASEQKIEEAGIDVSGFIAPGPDHTILGSDRFYTLEVEGVLFLDWFTAFVNGENIEDIHCTNC